MIIQGDILSDPAAAPKPGWLRIDGERIESVNLGSPPPSTTPECGGPGLVICPAFIDAHLHIPQIDSIGCDGMPLLQWLDRVIFPAETWWGAGAAPAMLKTAVRRMLREGTASFAGYLTSHAEINAEVLRRLTSGDNLPARLRFAAGRVAMDRNAPDALTAEDRTRAAMSPAPSPILPPPNPQAARAEPSANPRFAISCSDELLAEVGWACKEIAKTSGADILIQTHLAECEPEVRFVAELFPNSPNYTAVYDQFGLLTPRTLLAHAVHLSDEEFELVRRRGSVLVHCPHANVFLESGLFDLDRARDHDVRLALGSDVAAGSDIAMPRVARGMIETAKVRKLTIAPNAHIPTPADAWRLITQGNADAIGWADSGRLEPGAFADLLLLRVPETWRDEHLIGRLIYNWSSRLIEHRVIAGGLINPATI